MQQYIRALKEAGTSVSIPVIITAARGIVRAKDRSLLVEKQLSSGRQAREVKVETRMQVVKELSDQYLLGFLDYIQCKPEIVVNGLKEAGICGALDGLPQRSTLSDTSSDPFDDRDSEYE